MAARRGAWLGLLLTSWLSGMAGAEVADAPISSTSSPLTAAQWLQVTAQQRGLREEASAPREIMPGVWLLASRRAGAAGQVWAALACRQGPRLLSLEQEGSAGTDALKTALASAAERLARACAMAPASELPEPSSAAGSAQGWLLLSPPADVDADAAVLSPATGRWRGLPRSALAASYARRADHWTLGGPGLLVRRDARHQVTGWRLPELQPVGSFTLGQAVGTDEPGLYGELRPSPDGQWLLGVWRPGGRGGDRLVVLDWRGQVRREWPIEAHADRAWAWLPDGRVVVLREEAWWALALDGRSERLGQAGLPPGAVWRGAEIEVSPDGEQVVAVLTTQDAVARGEAAQHRLPYLGRLQGGPLQPLVRLPPGQLVSMSAVVRWGASGLWLLWGGRSGAYGAAQPAARCAELGWVPREQLQGVVVQGVQLPAELRGTTPRESCGGRLGVSLVP
ncbi:MAG: hypothetical protein K9J82_21415 [Methylotenera sp.]|nr:hypothetical protein [Methylotenera sp.]